ncbi:MAG: DNA methylase [Methylobacter sp.]|nr:DNA methylase [Methylobacter sp.]
MQSEVGWMYRTSHSDGTFGQISYVVWSEVFLCSSCAGETIFFEAAYDPLVNKIRKEVTCRHCGAIASKEQMELQFESFLDLPHNRIDKRPKLVPVLIKYTIGRSSFTKTPDKQDLAVIEKIVELGLPANLPTNELPDCQMTRVGRMKTTNTRCVHHMYLPRAAHILSLLWGKANEIQDLRLRNILRYWLDSQFTNMSKLNRYRPEVSFPYNPLSGVFYVPSLISEANPFTAYSNKVKRLATAFSKNHSKIGASYITCGNAGKLSVPDASIDYVFTDPPFGENIYYADLNILTESWYQVITNVQTEAIIDRVRLKGIPEYQHLMKRCFAEYFRVLKPGRWMTVVFSNSRASVWNAIQVSLQQVGFVVAEVTTLDKVNLSFQQVTSPNAVKQDLVISAYKPNGGLEDRFHVNGSTAESAWDFVHTHLKQLPAVKVTHGDAPELQNIVERDPRRIYDRMASWFIRHDVMVPISTPEFLAGLPQRFAERDGMIFLHDQVVEYDKKRMQIPQTRQRDWIVSDERSAIDWLSDFLKRRPSTYPEIQHEYFPVIGSAKKKGEIIPELSQLLEDNFLRYDGTGEVPSQIHSYLSTNHKDLRGLEKSNSVLVDKAKDRWFVPDPNKAQNLDKKREKALLKAFEVYQNHSGRRLKDFRLEVLRAGFKDAWSKKDYMTIINVAQKIPEDALQEDEKLLLWYDQALTRMESQ